MGPSELHMYLLNSFALLCPFQRNLNFPQSRLTVVAAFWDFLSFMLAMKTMATIVSLAICSVNFPSMFKYTAHTF